MDYTIIHVPDMNDSVSHVVLNNKYYQIRFTYIDTKDYWIFGLYDDKGNPIFQGVKIVPNAALNAFITQEKTSGVFAVKTKLDRVGRYSFFLGEAEFVFVPYEIVDD